jgi:hypothetical protein
MRVHPSQTKTPIENIQAEVTDPANSARVDLKMNWPAQPGSELPEQKPPQPDAPDVRETAHAGYLATFAINYAPHDLQVPQSLEIRIPVVFQENLDPVRISIRPAEMRHWGINE